VSSGSYSNAGFLENIYEFSRKKIIEKGFRKEKILFMILNHDYSR